VGKADYQGASEFGKENLWVEKGYYQSFITSRGRGKGGRNGEAEDKKLERSSRGLKKFEKMTGQC